jgi:hypothetical protein
MKFRLLSAVAMLFASSGAFAADVPVKAPAAAPSAQDMPFFFVNDNRITYAYQPNATEPSVTSQTARQVLALTHFDVWAYGTNFANLQVDRYDHNDPAGPCPLFGSSGCGGATEFYGLIRSTFGFNQIFNTKMFTAGPLQNVSLEVGGDWKNANSLASPETQRFFAGLQFAFDLPYHGYIDIAPGMVKEKDHLSFLTPAFTAPGPGVPDGNTDVAPAAAVEVNYYMDLGFLPDWLPLSVSGRAGVYFTRGTGTSVNIPIWTPLATQIESEPIRLTLDASRMIWGPKYSHFADVWVAYKYWQNKYGLDHNSSPLCTGMYAGDCTESSVYTGITFKF